MLHYNQDKINKLVSELRKAFTRLSGLRETGKDQFLSSADKIDSVKYNFVVAIEAAIDICNHIVSQNAFRAPDDYTDCFKVLQEQNIIDEEYLLKLQSMVRFRNRLVHIYWDIDNEKLYEILQNDLPDLELYLKKIIYSLKI